MPNFSNIFLQSLVEANRKTREEEEAELLNQMEEEDLEAAELGLEDEELSDEELEAIEQDELEADAQDVESLIDPAELDIGDPDEDDISDEDLDAIETEDDIESQRGPAIEDNQIPPEEEMPSEEAPQDDAIPAQDVPDNQDEVPDFDYDEQPPQEDGQEGDVPPEGAGGEAPPEEVADAPDPNADPNAAAAEQAPPDPTTVNTQVNILNISKLDRALAKKNIYGLFMDLRASMDTTLNIIDKNATVIDPAIREKSVTQLNGMITDLNTYISIKFQLDNYEAAMQMYMLFTEQFNALIEDVKTGDMDNKSNKHNNKGDSN